MKRERSYKIDVLERASRIFNTPYVAVREIGRVANGNGRAPLLVVRVSSGVYAGNKRNVLFSGGIHGDEPAGVEALFTFLEKYAFRYISKFNIYAYPCLNPFGYENNVRLNAPGADINRGFTIPPGAEEARRVIDSLRAGPERYEFTMDLHENDTKFETDEFARAGFTRADNPGGFWLWEWQADHAKRIGRRIVEEVAGAGIPVCTWPTIFGDVNSSGVIEYPEGRASAVYSGAHSLDAFLHGHYTDHAFATETISEWNMERRVQAHLIAMTMALDECAKR